MNENSKNDEVIKGLETNSTFRTMNIIEVMSVNNNLTLEELAPKASLSKPTLFRFLSTLCEIGYVTKNIDNRYSLTYKIFAVASKSLPETELSRISQPFMENISYRTGETSILGVLDGNSVLYLNKI